MCTTRSCLQYQSKQKVYYALREMYYSTIWAFYDVAEALSTVASISAKIVISRLVQEKLAACVTVRSKIN